MRWHEYLMGIPYLSVEALYLLPRFISIYTKVSIII